MISIDYKANGEKLLRIDVEIKDNKIRNIIITGDFFTHPEDVILKIEEALKGTEVERKIILEKIRAVIKENHARLIGLSPESIAEAIIRAKEKV